MRRSGVGVCVSAALLSAREERAVVDAGFEVNLNGDRRKEHVSALE